MSGSAFADRGVCARSPENPIMNTSLVGLPGIAPLKPLAACQFGTASQKQTFQTTFFSGARRVATSLLNKEMRSEKDKLVRIEKFVLDRKDHQFIEHSCDHAQLVLIGSHEIGRASCRERV